MRTGGVKLELKLLATNRRRFAAWRAVTRSETQDRLEHEEVEASNGANSRPLKSLISSNKCVSSAIRRTRSVQSFLKAPPPPAWLATTTSLTSCRSSDARSSPPAIGNGGWALRQWNHNVGGGGGGGGGGHGREGLIKIERRDYESEPRERESRQTEYICSCYILHTIVKRLL